MALDALWLGNNGVSVTHTLHRQGSIESLKEDYAVLIVGSDIPLSTQRERLRRRFPWMYQVIKKTLLRLGIPKALRLIKRPNPGFPAGGFVFSDKKELMNFLRLAKERNTGKSVVVSGLIDEVNGCLEELNLSPHTVQLSLGVFGKTELLPERGILEITTMCGHHMISPWLVEKLARDVKEGKLSATEAVKLMTKQCVCGVFNKARASKLIKALAR